MVKLAALGVTDTGQKQLLTLQLAAAEATASWGGLLADLQQRGLAPPLQEANQDGAV
jgi:transposase-like protein